MLRKHFESQNKIPLDFKKLIKRMIKKKFSTPSAKIGGRGGGQFQRNFFFNLRKFFFEFEKSSVILVVVTLCLRCNTEGIETEIETN